MSKKQLKKIIIISGMAVLFMPLFLEVFIFRNAVYSALSNGEWGGFLGSYIGGAFGGIGTLLAVYITTKETREIQKNTLQQMEKDRKLNEQKERIYFANDIAEIIAKYISEISVYFYECRMLERLNANLKKEKQELERINCDISHFIELEQENDSISHIEVEIKKLNQKKDMQKNRIEIIERDIEKHRVNRLVANECYFLVQMKLQNIEEGRKIIEQIEYIHKNSHGDTKNIEWDWMDKETNKLQNMTVCFMKDYIRRL